MSMIFAFLDDVRSLMLDEVKQDISNGVLYFSDRLSPAGKLAYTNLLQRSIATENHEWLAEEISSGNHLKSYEVIRTSKGPSHKRVPSNAPETLVEGEFNRFYIRALCRYAISRSVPEVEIYRAKSVSQSRSESRRLIGKRINPATLLADLQTHIGTQTDRGVPGGPNSGLSIRIPTEYLPLLSEPEE